MDEPKKISYFIRNNARRFIIYKMRILGGKRELVKLKRLYRVDEKRFLKHLESCHEPKVGAEISFLKKLPNIFFIINKEHGLITQNNKRHVYYCFAHQKECFLVGIPVDIFSVLDEYDLYMPHKVIQHKSKTLYLGKHNELIGIILYFVIYFHHGFNQQNKNIFKKLLYCLNVFTGGKELTL